VDVREIAAAGRAGDVHAAAVLNRAFTALGQSLAPWLLRFEAQVLVVGGSMAGSWDIVEPAIRAGLTGRFTELQGVPVVKATRADEAGLIGAAYWAAGKR
jgi:glucokinase